MERPAQTKPSPLPNWRLEDGFFFCFGNSLQGPSHGLDKEKGGPKARGLVLIGMGSVEPERLRALHPSPLPPRPELDLDDPRCLDA